MRVLFVNPGLAMGGAEQSLLLLLEGLRARGVEATIALFGDGPFRDRLSALNFPTESLEPPGLVRSATRYRLSGVPLQAAAMVAALPTAIRLAGMARRTRADLIHSNGLKAHLLGGVAGRIARTPVVWHLRDFPPQGLPGWALRWAACRLPSLVLANSDAVAAAIGGGDARGRSVMRVHNAVDLDRFHPGLPSGRIRQECGLEKNVPLVGMVAHLTPWKGHDRFLRIARAVLEKIPEAHFVVAGGPIYETDGHAGYPESLRRQALELGHAGRIAFLGARDDVPEVLADLDVLVHCPAAPEPFGRAVAEAMAVGRPVVAARCGGIPELVEDGRTGFLVSPDDESAFASVVIGLLSDPAQRVRLGEAARHRAEALFSLEMHVAGVLDAYRSVLAGRQGRA